MALRFRFTLKQNQSRPGFGVEFGLQIERGTTVGCPHGCRFEFKISGQRFFARGKSFRRHLNFSQETFEAANRNLDGRGLVLFCSRAERDGFERERRFVQHGQKSFANRAAICLRPTFAVHALSANDATGGEFDQVMPQWRNLGRVQDNHRTDRRIRRHQQRFCRYARRHVLEPSLDRAVEARLSLHFDTHHRVAATVEPWRIRVETHGEVRFRRANDEAIREVLAVPFQQVANLDDILAGLAEALFNSGVGADCIVVLLNHLSLRVSQIKHSVERRSKPAGFHFKDKGLVLLDLELELVHVFFAVDATVDHDGKIRRVRVGERIVRLRFRELGQSTYVEQNRIGIAFGRPGADFLLTHRRGRFNFQFHLRQSVKVAPAQRDLD